MHWPQFQRIDRLVISAGVSLPDLNGMWHEISTQRFLDFLAADMAKVAQLPPGAQFGWDHLANIFLYAIAGWLRAETAIRTVNEDEFLRYSDAVIAAIIAAVRPIPAALNCDKKD